MGDAVGDFVGLSVELELGPAFALGLFELDSAPGKFDELEPSV